MTKVQWERAVYGVGNHFLVPSPSNVLHLQQNDVNTFINCSISSSLEVLRVSVHNSSDNKTLIIKMTHTLFLTLLKIHPHLAAP